MKNLILIFLVTLVSCKNSPFDDDKGIRNASDRGDLLIKVPKKVSVIKPVSSTTTTTKAPSIESEKLLTLKEIQTLLSSEIDDLKDQKVKLHLENRKKLEICSEGGNSFDKQGCIKLLNSILITSRNINLICHHLRGTVLGDSYRDEIVKLDSSTLIFYKDYKEELEIIKNSKEK